MNDFTIIARSLRARGLSTAITIVTVAVAVGLMLVLLSMRDAGRRAFERGSGNMHLLVSRDASALVSVLNGVFHANAPQRALEWSAYESIRQRFPLEYAIPVQQGDSFRGFPVIATTQEFFTKFDPEPGPGEWSFRAGKAFDEPFEVVLGSEVAAATGLAIGDEVVLAHGMVAAHEEDDADHGAEHVHGDFDFHVAGILEPTGGPHDRAIMTDLRAAWILHAHDRRLLEDSHVHETGLDDLRDEDRKITGIYLRLVTRDGREVSGAIQTVFDELRRDPSLTVAEPGHQIRTLFAIVSNVDRIFIALAWIVMFSSGIAIFLALYDSIAQRRRQIAVMRVLGTSAGRIFGLVLTESALIGVIGAVAGVLIAAIGSRIVAGVLHARLGLVVEPVVVGAWTLPVLLATIGIAATAGLLPAALAYRTSVAENLRPIG